MDKELEEFADGLRRDLPEGKFSPWAEVYALDAVSQEERSILEEYLSSAPEDVRLGFAESVRQARETVTLVFASNEAEPPKDLLARIMQQLPPADSAAAQSGREDSGHDELVARRRRKQNHISAPRRWIIAAAAAAVLAIGSVITAQNLEPSVREQITQATDTYSATIDFPAGGTANIAASNSVNAAVVTLSGLPSLEAGKVYQMWRIPSDGSAPESVGTMAGEEAAAGATTVVEDIEPYGALALTIEPEGGSPSPTMPIVAQIALDL